MNRFTQPDPGENQRDFDERREAMIVFMIHRHSWPRTRAIEFLESLNFVGIAYVGVDMREERQRGRRDYDPLADAYRVV